MGRTGTSSAVRTAAFLLLAMGTVAGCSSSKPPEDGGTGPDRLAAQGRVLYERNCGVCHGAALQGALTGPSLLDPAYAPGRFPDSSFHAAVANGVEPKSGKFGAMPPQSGISPEQVRAIVAYVRSKQAEKGLTAAPSSP